MRGFLPVLLERHQVRRTRQQKDAFAAYLRSACDGAGYTLREEMNKTSRNLIAGDPDRARVIFTAHYDTCARSPLPNLIYPRSMLLTLLAQMPLVLVILALACAAAWGMAALTRMRAAAALAGYMVYFGLFSLLFFGPANRHTANDNTSGVAALLEIMAALPPAEKENAAFIFFDHEELGKVGSRRYARAHPGITHGKILLNLDCVGDGDDFLIVAPKRPGTGLERALKAAFADRGGKRALHCSAADTSYNSDQKSFPNGVAVAACRRGRLGYHVPRIHTGRDVICEESNLEYVTACALKLMEAVS